LQQQGEKKAAKNGRHDFLITNRGGAITPAKNSQTISKVDSSRSVIPAQNGIQVSFALQR
jgi:hypothetical protein